MNHKKLTILILIAIIISLSLVIPIREKQHSKVMAEYMDMEIQKEVAMLETYNEFTKNYNELYAEYNRLYGEYGELAADFGYYNDSWQDFICTGYSANDPQQGTNNIVATTFNLDYARVQNLPIVASNCIPLYSIIEIKGLGGFIVLDTGLGYKTDYGWEDENWVDILFDSKEEAINFGRQALLVRVIK